jgi:hypothetical protein
MTQEQEQVESLKMTNAIQQKIIDERGKQLVEAILCLHRLLPIAKKAVDPKISLAIDLNDFEPIERAEYFLHDER